MTSPALRPAIEPDALPDPSPTPPARSWQDAVAAEEARALEAIQRKHREEQARLKAEAARPAKPEKVPGRFGRFLANAITTVVGMMAGYVSWGHLYHLGTQHGAEQEASVLTPFTIDGMIVVGTLKMRQARLEGRPAHWAAYVAVLLGVAGTIAGNVAAAPDDTTARLFYAAPPVAFLVCVEVMFGRPMTMNLWDLIRHWWGRARRRRAEGAPLPSRRKGTTGTPGQPVADPKPADEPEQTQPVEKPAPDAPAPTPPAEKPAERSGPRPRPQAPAKRRTPAGRRRGLAGGGVSPEGYDLDSQGRVTGSKTRPAREIEIEGERTVLTGDDLKAHARNWVAGRISQGAERRGLGAAAARLYDPPMSERWGQERVDEVPDAAPVEVAPVPDGPVDGRHPDGTPHVPYTEDDLRTQREDSVPVS
jgi:hypothetical protein